MMKIDISADMGESFGRWKLGYDEELMERYSRVHLSDTTREALILERAGKHKQASA